MLEFLEVSELALPLINLGVQGIHLGVLLGNSLGASKEKEKEKEETKNKSGREGENGARCKCLHNPLVCCLGLIVTHAAVRSTVVLEEASSLERGLAATALEAAFTIVAAQGIDSLKKMREREEKEKN